MFNFGLDHLLSGWWEGQPRTHQLRNPGLNASDAINPPMPPSSALPFKIKVAEQGVPRIGRDSLKTFLVNASSMVVCMPNLSMLSK